MTIGVKYSCALCGLHRVTVDVQAREDEPIGEWMEAMARQLAEDHEKRSPICHPKQLTEVMVPMTGAVKLGGPALQ